MVCFPFWALLLPMRYDVRADREIGVFPHVAPPTRLHLEFPSETGLILCNSSVNQLALIGTSVMGLVWIKLAAAGLYLANLFRSWRPPKSQQISPSCIFLLCSTCLAML